MLNIYYFDQDIGPVTQKEPLKPNFIQAKKIDELIPSLDDAYNPKNIPHYSSKVINDFVIQQVNIVSVMNFARMVQLIQKVLFTSYHLDMILRTLFKKQLNAWKLKWHEMTLS